MYSQHCNSNDAMVGGGWLASCLSPYLEPLMQTNYSIEYHNFTTQKTHLAMVLVKDDDARKSLLFSTTSI